MTTTVESQVDMNQLRNKIGVNEVIIRGNKVVIRVDPFFSRSILSHIERWHDQLELVDIDFEEKELLLEV